jgi:hypothetical protein
MQNYKIKITNSSEIFRKVPPSGFFLAIKGQSRGKALNLRFPS